MKAGVWICLVFIIVTLCLRGLHHVDKMFSSSWTLHLVSLPLEFKNSLAISMGPFLFLRR